MEFRYNYNEEMDFETITKETLPMLAELEILVYAYKDKIELLAEDYILPVVLWNVDEHSIGDLVDYLFYMYEEHGFDFPSLDAVK